MHLEPFLSESLAPGRSVYIRGRIGIHVGDRESLREKIALFLSAGDPTKPSSRRPTPRN